MFLCSLSLVACPRRKLSTASALPSADASGKPKQTTSGAGALSSDPIAPLGTVAHIEETASDWMDRRNPKLERCSGCSYREQAKVVKDWARESGMKRIQNLIVEKERSSVEVYQSTSRGDQVIIQVVAAGYELTTFEGSEGSEARLNKQPLGAGAPVLFELTVTDCPGGTCMASCGTGSTNILLMSSKDGLAYVPFGSRVRSAILDEDQDGFVEFTVSYPSASLGACAYHWCCFANTAGPSLSHYVGWSGHEWRDDLPRLRKFYEKQQEANGRQVELLRKSDRKNPKVRCDLASASTQLFWLGQLFGEDVPDLKKPWVEDLKGWKPIDCFIEDNSALDGDDSGPSLNDNLQSLESFMTQVLEWKPAFRYAKGKN